MDIQIQSDLFKNMLDDLCPGCKARYNKLLENKNMKSLDRAILGKEAQYEEEIELYKTYGGD